jgi:transcription antitermination protein NusB
MDAPPPEKPRRNRRHENRVAAMQFLYLWESQRPANPAAALTDFLGMQENPRDHYAFAESLIDGALRALPEIDRAIELHAENWSLERIAKVELAVLRLAVHELLHRRDIPPVVSINEAVELAKAFGGDDSHRFVNGILDRVKEGLDLPLREAAEG